MRTGSKIKLLLSMFCLSATPIVATADEAYSLSQLTALMLTRSPAHMAAYSQVEAARSAVTTAGAIPNPELEYLQGPVKARAGGVNTGSSRSLTLTQPLEIWGQRGARIAAAEAGLESAQATRQMLEAELVARLRVRFYELLRRQAEQKAAREDLDLTEKIHSRIALRVETGEAPRFELVKAETELLNAQKQMQASQLRVRQASAALRALVGRQLSPEFVIEGRLDQVPHLSGLENVREEVKASNPEVRRARAEQQKARQQLEAEKALRWPQLALKLGNDEDPDTRTQRVGVVLTLPLWDQRRGPVGEARANLVRSGYDLEQQEFALEQGLEAAYQQYRIAEAQVLALQSGIVKQAEAALNTAEAAYRFGERGILDVLDAQRVYRAARNELIAARFELASAWAEVERLRAQPVVALAGQDTSKE